MLMNGLGSAKDASAGYSWILAASQAGDHRGDDYLPALRASLDQQRLAEAAERAHSLQTDAMQASIRNSLVP
jgi:hypothetical protein